ncbi:MAG: NYN domain-containing protein [Betaproteobacteria bacterium]|nr:NYN domain-containing protein [Betaproteobacteria bacterium]
MDRYAIFVDAGYFFAAGAQAAFKQYVSRRQVALKSSPAAMIADLCSKAGRVVDNLPLLRTYWYDATPGSRLTMEQSTLAMLPGVKLRIGVLNNIGKQKGVDSLIVTDIIDLSRNRAIADVVLMTGDEDLRIAVQVAQSFGVRVHLLGCGELSRNMSEFLQMEADSVTTLEDRWFASHLEINNELPYGTTSAMFASAIFPPGEDYIQDEESFNDAVSNAIDEILSSVGYEQMQQLNQHFAYQTFVPTEYDRRLVGTISAKLNGRKLNPEEMRSLRTQFMHSVKSRSSKWMDSGDENGLI